MFTFGRPLAQGTLQTAVRNPSRFPDAFNAAQQPALDRPDRAVIGHSRDTDAWRHLADRLTMARFTCLTPCRAASGRADCPDASRFRLG
jgi:hypothetical protein